MDYTAHWIIFIMKCCMTWFALAYLVLRCAVAGPGSESAVTADHVTQHRQCFVYISAALTNTHRNVLLQLDHRRPYCPRPYKSSSAVFVSILLLVAGLEPNPGPPTAAAGIDRRIRFGLFNARSAVRKAAFVRDVIADHALDVIAVTESWMRSDDPGAITLDIVPPDYCVIHAFRDSALDGGSDGQPSVDDGSRGGGIALVYRPSIKATQLTVGSYTQFELLAVKLEVTGSQPVVNVCRQRPGSSSPTSQFFDELCDLFDTMTDNQHYVLCGDFSASSVG